VAPDGKKHKIEVLGDGQQVVVEGIHPDTEQPYAWLWGQSPLTVTREELPAIDEAEALKIADEAVAVLTGLGWTLAGGTTTTSVHGADNIVLLPVTERIEKMQYQGEFGINDTLLAYTGEQLRSGIPCDDVIKEGLGLSEVAGEDRRSAATARMGLECAESAD
jgi:hypothetical protein